MSYDALLFYTRVRCFPGGDYPETWMATALDLAQHSSLALFIASWLLPFVLGYRDLFHLMISVGSTLCSCVSLAVAYFLDNRLGLTRCGDEFSGPEARTAYVFFVYIIVTGALLRRAVRLDVFNATALAALPFSVALARLALRYNYFLDVALGALLGILLGSAWHVFVFTFISAHAGAIVNRLDWLGVSKASFLLTPANERPNIVSVPLDYKIKF